MFNEDYLREFTKEMAGKTVVLLGNGMNMAGMRRRDFRAPVKDGQSLEAARRIARQIFANAREKDNNLTMIFDFEDVFAVVAWFVKRCRWNPGPRDILVLEPVPEAIVSFGRGDSPELGPDELFFTVHGKSNFLWWNWDSNDPNPNCDLANYFSKLLHHSSRLTALCHRIAQLRDGGENAAIVVYDRVVARIGQGSVVKATIVHGRNRLLVSEDAWADHLSGDEDFTIDANSLDRAIRLACIAYPLLNTNLHMLQIFYFDAVFKVVMGCLRFPELVCPSGSSLGQIQKEDGGFAIPFSRVRWNDEEVRRDIELGIVPPEEEWYVESAPVEVNELSADAAPASASASEPTDEVKPPEDAFDDLDDEALGAVPWDLEVDLPDLLVEQEELEAELGSAILTAAEKRVERELLRLGLELEGSRPSREISEGVRRAIVTWVEDRAGAPLPEAAHRHRGFSHFAGGWTTVGIRLVEDEADEWAIRATWPDERVAMLSWTVECVVRVDDWRVEIGVRTFACGGGELLDPGVPEFLARLGEGFAISRRGRECRMTPFVVGSDETARSLAERVLDPARPIPLAVVGASDGGETCVDPGGLARTLAGAAEVAVLPASRAAAFVEAVGRTLSVPAGAVRLFPPGARFGDASRLNPLWFSSGEVDGEAVAASVRGRVAADSLVRFSLEDDVPTFASARLRRLKAAGDVAETSERLSLAEERAAFLEEELEKALGNVEWLSREHAEAEEREENVKAMLRAAELRITHLLRPSRAEQSAEIPLPDGWPGFSAWCDEWLAGAVSLSVRARRELDACPLFEDPALAARALLWLATEYREARIVGSGDDLRGRFASGLNNDRCGSDSFGFNVGEKRLTAEWHVTNGTNTRDPTRCMRIYYAWDPDERMVFVASMPAHVRNAIS